MSRVPRPLTPLEARDSLANRLGPRVDRIRQIATRLGVRPMRVWLVWTQFSGDERGEGRETEVKRMEILPTPKVENLDSVAMSAFSAGVIEVGSIRVSRISSMFTDDLLRGRVAGLTYGDAKHLNQRVSFFYEVQEDGRALGGPAPLRKYRISTEPYRRAGKVDWTIVLERISEDRTRSGQSQIGEDR